MEYNVKEILERIRSVINEDKNIGLSKAFNVSANSISRWKSTNTINLNLVYKFALKNKVSFIWLITGIDDFKIYDNSKYKFIKDIARHIDYGIENNVDEQNMLQLIIQELQTQKLKFEISKK